MPDYVARLLAAFEMKPDLPSPAPYRAAEPA